MYVGELGLLTYHQGYIYIQCIDIGRFMDTDGSRLLK